MQLKSWLLYGSILFNMLFIGVSAIYLLPALTAGNREQPLPMPYEALDLSSGQKTAFEAERDTFHGVLGEIGQDIRTKQAALIHLLAAEKPDREAIAAKQREIVHLQDTLQNKVIGHLLRISEMLTPEQRNHFFQLLQERMETHAPSCPAGIN